MDPAQGPEPPGTYSGSMQFKVSGQDYLTSPASAPVTVPGHSSVTILLSITMPRQPVATADLYTVHPVPGPWQIDVVLDLTVSGKEFTQTVSGSLADP